MVIYDTQDDQEMCPSLSAPHVVGKILKGLEGSSSP